MAFGQLIENDPFLRVLGLFWAQNRSNLAIFGPFNENVLSPIKRDEEPEKLPIMPALTVPVRTD
jgi:hypothetical protein